MQTKPNRAAQRLNTPDKFQRMLNRNGSYTQLSLMYQTNIKTLADLSKKYFGAVIQPQLGASPKTTQVYLRYKCDKDRYIATGEVVAIGAVERVEEEMPVKEWGWRDF